MKYSGEPQQPYRDNKPQKNDCVVRKIDPLAFRFRQHTNGIVKIAAAIEQPALELADVLRRLIGSLGSLCDCRWWRQA
jgi:hypothetical protein